MAGYLPLQALCINPDSLLSFSPYEGSLVLRKDTLGAQGTTDTLVCEPSWCASDNP